MFIIDSLFRMRKKKKKEEQRPFEYGEDENEKLGVVDD